MRRVAWLIATTLTFATLAATGTAHAVQPGEGDASIIAFCNFEQDSDSDVDMLVFDESAQTSCGSSDQTTRTTESATEVTVTTNTSIDGSGPPGGEGQGGGQSQLDQDVIATGPAEWTLTGTVSASASASREDIPTSASALVEFAGETRSAVCNQSGIGSCNNGGPISASGTLTPGQSPTLEVDASCRAIFGSCDADWNFVLTVRETSADTDGDALPDSWEEDGVDVDGDGTPDLDLPSMGADPDHKDIFVEVDHMPGHRIPDAQIARVVQAFADAPVANPDAQTGITLHVDNGSGSVMDPPTGATWGVFSDQEEVPHQNVLGTENGDGDYEWSQFEALRSNHFAVARRPVFHYAIAAHSGPDNDFSGIAQDIPGGDFAVMAHETCIPSQPVAVECTPDADGQAATFMHELGHTLGLRHGGSDGLNRKPNYLSVMNYNFGFGLRQFTGVGNQTEFALDYSQFAIPLDERSLDEQHAFPIASGPATAYATLYRCPGSGTRRVIPVLDTPVDWTCNGQISTFLTTADITMDDPPERTNLPGAIDWTRLVFDGGAVGDLAEPPAPDTTPLDEPTPAEMIAAQEALAAGPVDDSGLPREPAPGSDPPPADPPPAEEPPPADPPADPKPRNDFGFGKVKKNKRNGTAKLTVNVPGPGTLELAKGKTVKGDETQAEAAGEEKLLVTPKGAAKENLNRRGKAKVSAQVTYTPTGGDPNTQSQSIKLVKKRRSGG